VAYLPEPSAVAVFLVAAVALILTPGPDTLFVLSRGIERRAVGVGAALGVAAGVCAHTLAAALGIAVVYRTVPGAEAAVRYVGGAYLAYLGVRTLRRARKGDDPGPDVDRDGDEGGTAIGGFRSGFLVNALNPQVALFFLAFLPGFASGPTAEVQMAVLGATYAAITAVYLSAVAVAADVAAGVVRSPAARRRLDGLAGAVLLALGVRVALGG